MVYDITCGDYNWKVGKEEAPIRLKLLKGLPGLNNNDMVLYVTVECFISEGLADEPGAVTWGLPWGWLFVIVGNYRQCVRVILSFQEADSIFWG